MVKRSDGRWQERVVLPDGKVKYVYARTKSALVQKIVGLKEEASSSPLFSDVADEWDAAHEAEVSYNGHKCYKKPLASAKEAFGSQMINSITSPQIDSYIRRIASRGFSKSESKQQPFSKRTVKLYLTCVKLVFDHALLKGYIDHNPCNAVSVPSKLKTSRRDLPDKENIKRIKAHVGDEFGLFAFFLLYTGCRRNEALALTYEDIDWDNHIIHVNKSIVWKPNQPEVKDTKTEAGDRLVVLVDALEKKLDRNGRGFIFHNDGKYMSQTAYRRRWDKYVKESGITCTPHQLRHLFATILYEAGIDEILATEMMGHTSTKITHDIYTHIRMDILQKGISTLNKKIKI